MPLFASIDVGSNTLRLLIAKLTDHQIIDIFTARKITRLGTMVDQTGMLQRESMAASLDALREFSAVMVDYGVTEYRAVATSALREAENSDIFIRQVEKETGIRIEVISGEEEAELILRGILLASPFLKTEILSRPLRARPQGIQKGKWDHSLFLMDIGGGSTEWIVYQGEDRILKGSLPSGVIKLTQKCIGTDPVSADDVERLNGEIHSVLEDLRRQTKNRITKTTLFIGTGGTFTTLASVDLALDAYVRTSIHLHRIPLTKLRKMQRRFLGLSLSERKHIQGLEPERADLIIPGAQFTMRVMELFNFSELTVSDYGLLEGALSTL